MAVSPPDLASAEPVCLWHIKRMYTGIEIVLINGRRRRSTLPAAKRVAVMRVLMYLADCVLRFPLIGLVTFLLLPFSVLYGMGALLGQTLPFAVAGIAVGACGLALLAAFGRWLVLRLRLQGLKQQLEVAKELLAESERLCPQDVRLRGMPKTLDELRSKFGRCQLEADSVGFLGLIKSLLLFLVGPLLFLIASPASPLESQFGSAERSYGNWAMWTVERYFNWLLADLPEAIFGKFSPLEPATPASRLAVWLLKAAVVASVVLYVVTLLRRIWKREYTFQGTAQDLELFMTKNALHLELDNLRVTQVGELRVTNTPVRPRDVCRE
jgi:hypothetical protein